MSISRCILSIPILPSDLEELRSHSEAAGSDQKGLSSFIASLEQELEGVYKQIDAKGFNARPQDDPRILNQTAQGKIRITPGNKPIISLMKNANASTFIHETGHQWLEEMVRDATHPAAPLDVKTDAATVRKWLGAKEGEQITTRQHEKFARGFEQYMREGIAPSSKLASVFAKFKSWLTTIYKTMQGLGAPINDDIRAVFDRQIASDPQHTIIVPERESQPTLADIHTADAHETPPHEAHATMDRVLSESAQYATDLHPSIKEEHNGSVTRDTAAQPAGEGGQGAQGLGNVDESGGRPALIAGSEPRSGTHGNIDAGGAKARGEVPSVAGGTGGAGKSEPDAARIPASPNASFGPPTSDFIDKAGNIRLDTLKATDDVKQAIRDAAKANDDFMHERRYVVSDGQMSDLADALGMDAQKINERKIGQAFNAEEITAARRLLLQSATAVSEAAKKASTGTDADLIAYAQAKARHQGIQGQVAGITAEAGRALRAFRNMNVPGAITDINQFLKDATGRTLFQLKQEADLLSKLETPQQVSQFVNSANKRTFGRMVLEYWINGLISGPATHSTYLVGNLITALQKVGPETAITAGIGKLRSMTGREGERVRIGEVGAQIKGAGKAIAPALTASIDAVKSGVQGYLPGEKPWVPPYQIAGAAIDARPLNESATYREVFSAAYGIVHGLQDGLIAGAKLLAEGGVKDAPMLGTKYSPLGQIPDFTVKGVNVLPLGSVVRLPGRAISGIHSFFRAMNYSMEKSAIAYRTAAEEGLTGTKFDARVADIRSNPSQEIMDASAAEATHLSLMGRGGAFTQAVARLTNAEILGFPLLKFIDPFVVVSSNIIDEGLLKRTPLAFLSPEIRADLLGKNGNVAQDRAQARVVAGSTLAITFGALAAQGLVTGSEPPERSRAAMWRMAGNQAHSVRIGEMWYSVNRLGPIGMLVGASADLYEVAHATEKGEFIDAAAQLHHAFTQNILDESFARGPSELLQAVQDPARYGQSYIRNFIAGFVPFSVGLGQINRATDPYSRQAKTVIEAMKAKIPGLSETLLPKRDIWGEPVPNKTVLGVPGFSAIYTSKISQDPVNITLWNLGFYPAPVQASIRNVKLNEQQYDDFSRIAGRAAKMQLDKLVTSKEFQTLPNFAKHQVIDAAIKGSREMARGIVMQKYPEIPRAAMDAKAAKFTDAPTP